MNLTDYTLLLSRPELVNNKKTDMLDQIVTEFPYFQSARALRLKGLYNQNSFQYNYALKITAAYTTDRSVLFDFITSDTFTAIQKGLNGKQHTELHEMDVTAPVEVIITEPEDKVEASILLSIRESENAKNIEVCAETVFPEIETVMEVVPDVEDELIEIMRPEDVELKKTVEALETLTENLGVGLPLEFSTSEKHSFSEWLQLSSFKPIERAPRAESIEIVPVETFNAELESPEWHKKQELINRFIENNPKIPPVRQDYVAQNQEPQREDSSLMTETLARVYLEQKKYQKAIQAYEILILKYPEKSIFFADRISDIKKLQQNNS